MTLCAATVACNIPQSAPLTPTMNAPTSSASPFAPTETPTLAPTIVPTDKPIPPTKTPAPCDPHQADFCITNGRFLFQRPILPPDNDLVDLTYLFGETQNHTRDPHSGVEFVNAFGTPVYAAGDGEIVFAAMDKTTKLNLWTNFYGNVVLIRHAENLYTLYAHLSQILVKEGDYVLAGDKIGEVGQTGVATGSHLHFETRVGDDGMDYLSAQNPILWLIPKAETGAISIFIERASNRKIEIPLTVKRYTASGEIAAIYYLSTYAKGFERSAEDAALSDLPPGQYQISFVDAYQVRERKVIVQAGKLTEVVFDIK